MLKHDVRQSIDSYELISFLSAIALKRIKGREKQLKVFLKQIVQKKLFLCINYLLKTAKLNQCLVDKVIAFLLFLNDVAYTHSCTHVEEH